MNTQQPPSYAYNADAARKADSGSIINQTGIYTGRIKEAKHIEAGTGATGIEFAFESRDGQSARYMTIYTVKKNGDDNAIGLGHVNALQTLLGVQGIQATQAHNMDGNVSWVFPQLCGPISILMQHESYKKNNGDIGSKMNIIMFCDAQTRQSAKEKMDGSPAQTAEYRLAGLSDSVRQNDAPYIGDKPSDNAPQQNGMPVQTGMAPAGFDDDEEPPF